MAERVLTNQQINIYYLCQRGERSSPRLRPRRLRVDEGPHDRDERGADRVGLTDPASRQLSRAALKDTGLEGAKMAELCRFGRSPFSPTAGSASSPAPSGPVLRPDGSRQG